LWPGFSLEWAELTKYNLLPKDLGSMVSLEKKNLEFAQLLVSQSILPK